MMCKWLLVALLSFAFPATAEIQRVVVQWKGMTCNNPKCLELLYQQFSIATGVAAIQFIPQSFAMEILWKPTVPFTYQAILVPMQRVGPVIESISVRVRGLIRWVNGQLWIVSIGDNTPFLLIGPTQPVIGGRAQYSTYTYHTLDQATQTVLLQAIQQGRVLIIEGPLLLPERSPPLQLSVASLQIEQPVLQPQIVPQTQLVPQPYVQPR